VLQVAAVPAHALLVAFQVHPMSTHSVWYDDDPLQ
jgi:hypothetical protein